MKKRISHDAYLGIMANSLLSRFEWVKKVTLHTMLKSSNICTLYKYTLKGTICWLGKAEFLFEQQMVTVKV